MPLKSSPYGLIDGQLLFSTDVDWEGRRQTFPADALVSVDLEQFKADPNGAPRRWSGRPQDKQTKQGAANTAESLYVSLLDNVRGRVLKFDYVDGEWVSRAKSPCPTTRRSMSLPHRTGSDEIMYSVTDFLTPVAALLFGRQRRARSDQDQRRAISTPRAWKSNSTRRPARTGRKIPYFLVKPEGHGDGRDQSDAC